MKPECSHRWESSPDAWGIVFGVTRCTDCGAVAREADFPKPPKKDSP